MSTRTLLAALLAGAIAACGTTGSRPVFETGEATLRVREAQTRSVQGADRHKVMRAVVLTMQDLGFMVTGADAALGTVTGRKFTIDSAGKSYDLRMTVSVRERDGGDVLVRASAEFNAKPVEDPKAYQNFFAALGKSVYLETARVQ